MFIETLQLLSTCIWFYFVYYGKWYRYGKYLENFLNIYDGAPSHIIQLKYVMRDIGSSHCPEPRFISRGAGQGNKHGRGLWLLSVSRNNHTLTILLYRYNTFMPVYLHLLSFFMTM